MGKMIDLDGHTFFHDRSQDRELANRLALQIDLASAVVMVGTPGEQHQEELVFDDVTVRHALRTVVDAMRRHSYRHRRVTPIPKPVRNHCELCQGERTIRNPYSGELFDCPVCR